MAYGPSADCAFNGLMYAQSPIRSHGLPSDSAREGRRSGHRKAHNRGSTPAMVWRPSAAGWLESEPGGQGTEAAFLVFLAVTEAGAILGPREAGGLTLMTTSGSKREREMFTRMATYTFVLMRSASADIDEVWDCNTKLGSMSPISETATIEGNQLFIGGRRYTIFDSTEDHMLAGTVIKQEGYVMSKKEDYIVTSYIFFERLSGRMTEFNDSAQVILRDGVCCDPPSSHSVCERKR
jgi:hypothetical protein